MLMVSAMDLHPLIKSAPEKCLRLVQTFFISSMHSLKYFLPAALLVTLLTSCAPQYFSPVSGDAFTRRDLQALSGRELWHGFVFNGEKVGFARLKIEPEAGGQSYTLFSEASLRIRFLGMGKSVSIRGEDRVAPDLSLLSFRYEQTIDEKTLALEGGIRNGLLSVVQRSGNEVKTSETKISSPLYPSSGINLYPVLRGMKTGADYAYPVYDPQTQSIVDVAQSVVAFEESRRLGIEPSFKLETRMSGHVAESWINLQGETVFERGMGGVLITFKESERGAKSFLAEASMGKKDLIYDFSLIRTDTPITCPRKADFLEATVEVPEKTLSPLQSPHQHISPQQQDKETAWIYRIHKIAPDVPDAPRQALNAKDRFLFLAPFHHIESDHPEILEAARKAVAGAQTTRGKVERLTSWVANEIKDEPVDSFSALEVLHNRKGECQAHTLLYTAMARALGIPTRLAGGIVYMEGMGFLYHAWAESFVDDWLPVDATFNQVPVDATHIKLVEGPDWISLLPMGSVIGHIRIRNIRFHCGENGN
ncbi:MAG TPA: transglutaminase-like domain-containing protein [Smithellaceae bacterium]|jgi:hypothetical protein|nr:transglutaminase-like domain-containing protein [Smithellaceae bacterium]HPO22499.1 transglutaminase-like domain-containing protein [Smithellaceae bacterium]